VAKLSRAGESTGPRKSLVGMGGQPGAAPDTSYGAKRARPFARRALRTARPPLVAERARKPWVLARLRQLGWKVRFMIGAPEDSVSG
jgi:hypothetical protein